MIPLGSNNERLTDIGAYIGSPVIVAACNSVTAFVTWMVYKCSDIVEQSGIPEGSNDERLTDLDIRKCYIHNTSLLLKLSYMY